MLPTILSEPRSSTPLALPVLPSTQERNDATLIGHIVSTQFVGANMITRSTDGILSRLMARAAHSPSDSLQRRCAQAVDGKQWRASVCAQMDKVLTALIARAPERGASAANRVAFREYVDSTHRGEMRAALLLLLRPTDRWIAWQFARDWDRGALTFVRDVMRTLSPLLVENKLFWGDFRLADGPVKQLALQWMPVREGGATRVAGGADRIDAPAQEPAQGQGQTQTQTQTQTQRLRASSSDVAKVAFSVFQRHCRCHAAYRTVWVPPISWSLTDFSALPSLFGQVLPVSWFVEMDRVFGNLPFPECRRTFAVLLDLVEAASPDIYARKVCAYQWLVATPQNLQRYQTVLNAHSRLSRLSAWADLASPLGPRSETRPRPRAGPGPDPLDPPLLGATFCDYDYPRINPLIDRLIHDRGLSDARVDDFVRISRGFVDPGVSSEARARLRVEVERLLAT